MSPNGSRRGFLWLAASALAAVITSPAPAAGPYVFHAITPCRVADTRNAVGTNGGPAVTSLVQRNFQVRGVCGVPVEATAATLNLTIVTPQAAGWGALFPSVTGWSGISTINFVQGEFAIANGAIVPLSTSATLDLGFLWQGYSGTNPVTHVIVDVTGYFRSAV